MSLLPPTVTKPAAMSVKPSAPKVGRKPAARAPQNVKVESEAPRDTPTPPTMPVPDDAEDVNRILRAPKARAGSLEARIAQSLASFSVIPTFVGDPYSSFIIASRSEKFAHDLAELAKVNPRVKKMLENALDGGVYGGVIFSGMAMVIPILVRYGIIPGDPSFDPFAMFYPAVPPNIVPSARAPRERTASRAASPVGDGPVTRVPPSQTGAPGATTPPGVVTVQPGMHPPVSPAAAGQ